MGLSDLELYLIANQIREFLQLESKTEFSCVLASTESSLGYLIFCGLFLSLVMQTCLSIFVVLQGSILLG